MFIELHIIQNFVPSCLNRDDTNAPKDCEFGGYRRARISSQCIKRSIRRYFGENAEGLGVAGLLGQRTKLLASQLVDRLVAQGKDRDKALKVVSSVIEAAGLKTDEAAKTSVLLFLGPDEMDRAAGLILKKWNELAAAQPSGHKAKEKAPPPVNLSDVLREGTRAVDVALFGRMVAELPEARIVNAACQVAHAISTHRVDMDMDFFTAVDDLQPREESGAGMMGVIEFNSSCFYRYALLDTRQLADNLGSDRALARTAALAFVQAAVHAIPTGRQNSMAAQNPPLYVRLIARDGGSPRNLANAFLAPVRPSEAKDLGQASIEKLEKHLADLKRMYGDAGAKLDRTASIYGEGSIDGLVAALKEALA
ncbi:MAG: type I-E CRISPR-associated protein Cas7/Cse4/CasC [Planctomycetes bacterium]|nr:type I-E CRISPR-associated protein Cas7/Cse4/CasC [Planctomycetota bacterium]